MVSTTLSPVRLWVVPTPIGHLKDISLRALEVLKSVDWIACEDTRVTQRLLEHYGITQTLYPLHRNNERRITTKLLEKLANSDQAGALVSDAGTPLVSDPGLPLVQGCWKLNLRVAALPGACAAVVGLVASGLTTEIFTFAGFLPRSRKDGQALLSQLAKFSGTVIFYEAPHRLQATLQRLGEAWGWEREVVLAKELTKVWEHCERDSVQGWLSRWSQQSEKLRGEHVILVGPAQSGAHASSTGLELEFPWERAMSSLVQRWTPSEALSLLADWLGVPKKWLRERWEVSQKRATRLEKR